MSEQVKGMWNDTLVWTRIIAGMFMVVTFFLVRTMNKIDMTHDWMLKHESTSIIYIEKIIQVENRVRDLENGNHSATADRYTARDADLKLAAGKAWAEDRFVKKPGK